MTKPGEHLSELSTYILLVRVLIAAAWADKVLEDREREFIKSVVSRIRLSEARRELLLFETETPPTQEDIDAVLEELCHRARTEEMRDAIIALVDMMIATDKRTREEEIDFREKLKGTLRNNGKRFYETILSGWIGGSGS